MQPQHIKRVLPKKEPDHIPRDRVVSPIQELWLRHFTIPQPVVIKSVRIKGSNRLAEISKSGGIVQIKLRTLVVCDNPGKYRVLSEI